MRVPQPGKHGQVQVSVSAFCKVSAFSSNRCPNVNQEREMKRKKADELREKAETKELNELFGGGADKSLMAQDDHYAEIMSLFCKCCGCGVKRQSRLLMTLLMKYRSKGSIPIDEVMKEVEQYLAENKTYLEQKTGVQFEDHVAFHQGLRQLRDVMERYEPERPNLTVVPGGRDPD
jgi:hypothetical protein